jgi:hypothetical protein
MIVIGRWLQKTFQLSKIIESCNLGIVLGIKGDIVLSGEPLPNHGEVVETDVPIFG